jgi:hypothetical protein
MPASFCLPLTAFEQYMLADDTPLRPMTILVRWRLQGRAEREPLTAAFRATTAAHPFFTARIERRGTADVWVDGAEAPPLDWAEAGTELDSSRGHCIDLRQEPGSRFWVRVSADATELTALVHHAVADGIGCLQFFADWLSAYAQQLAGQPSALRAPASADLLLRDKLDLAPPVPLTIKMRAQGVIAILFETFKFNCLRPIDLREDVAPPKVDTRGIDELITLTMTPEESSAVLRAANAQSVTLNDLMLRDAYLTIVAWRALHAPRARLRLTVPISMRDKTHEKLPACNVMSYVSLTRRVADTPAPEALLQGIHEEMKLIRYWRIGGWFLGMIGLAHRLRILKPALRLPVCYSTLVFSNLGRVTTIVGDRLPRPNDKYVAGNLVLEEITGAPPTRLRTPLSAAVFYYNQQLTISLRVDENVISRTGGRAWLDLYRQQLLASAAHANVTPPLADAPSTTESAAAVEAEQSL